ncbi:MAG: DeoR/GlpR transcriptional regulator [Sulfobacillus thermosulfidooxidans]|uniref:DeoR/GlpR transcriptional regulator n=1 Tax=Sulfobacillus thermosulfidooxidans TaxID=28034 RepID=A0A2T2X4X5_SULTH|nr:MAG: DeoR/GlpR transcriptional regulator [Sulfobacillus thermosulfidooxidans]
MRPRERQEKVLTWIAKHGSGSVKDLARELGVSEMTIRRDLRVLQQHRLLEHVTGGVEVKRSATELAFEVKRRLYQAEKQAIARQAIQLIESGMTIAFSAGTTTWAIAHALRGFRHLTFVTNSTNIALELQQQGWSHIILTGGNFRTPSDALVGPFAEYTARHLHTDLLFLGVHGLDVEEGMSTPNIQEAAIDRVFIHHAERVAVVMDPTKWGVKALAHIAPIEDIDTIITCDTPSSRLFAPRVAEKGVEMILAPVNTEEMANSHDQDAPKEVYEGRDV